MFVYFMIGHQKPDPTPMMEFALTLETKDDLTPEQQAEFKEMARAFVKKIETA